MAKSQDMLANLLQGLQVIIDRGLAAPAAATTAPVIQMLPDMAGTIGEFKGSSSDLSAKEWIDNLEQVATILSWTDNTRLAMALANLRGTARDWQGGMGRTFPNWEEWKGAFLESFPDEASAFVKWTKMTARVQEPGEDIEKYIYAKERLGRRCNLEFRDISEYILAGFEDRVQMMNLQGQKFNNVTELVQAAKRQQNLEKAWKKKKKPNPDEKRLQSLQGCAEGKAAELPRGVDSTQSIKGFKKSNLGPKCYACNKYAGHLAVDCPEPKRLRCDICKGKDHMTKDCRKKNVKVQLHKMSSETYEVQLFSATINEKWMAKVFVDNGADVSLIKKSLAEDWNLLTKPSYGRELKGFGGGSSSVCGHVDFSIQLEDFKTKLENVVVVSDQDQPYDLILGRDWISKPGLQLVFNEGRMTISKVEDDREELWLEHDAGKQDKCISKETSYIPGHFIGWVRSSFSTNGVFHLVEKNTKSDPLEQFIVPRCVVQTNQGEAYVPIVNLGKRVLKIKKGDTLSETHPVEEDRMIFQVTNCKGQHPMHDEEVLYKIKMGTQLAVEEREELKGFLQEYRDCFATKLEELGYTDLEEHRINLTENKRIRKAPYRVSNFEREVIQREVLELEARGIVQPSTSPFTSPVVLVRKSDGNWRLCIDYRALNSVTQPDCYPVPSVEDHLSRLSGMKLFANLDMHSGYYQVKVAKESQPLTAFVTSEGVWEFTRMPYGLTNAPATFARVVDKLLGNLKWTVALAFLDDILVPAPNWEELMRRLRLVFDAIRKAGVTLRPSKCAFGMTEVKYLGFLVSAEGIRPDPEQVKGVVDFPIPTDVHKLRSFIGLASYFRRYIKEFSARAAGLTQLLKKGVQWNWSETQQSAFQDLKHALVQAPVLKHFANEHETELHTDASLLGLAAALIQKDPEGNLRPVAYVSRRLTPAEEKYHSSLLEVLAVVWATERLRQLLFGRHFTVITDNAALVSLQSKKDLRPHMYRWLLKLQEYDFTVKHRPGRNIPHVDALSRNPVEEAPIFDMEGTQEVFFIAQEIDLSELAAVQYGNRETRNLIDLLGANEADLSSAQRQEKEVAKTDHVLKKGMLYRKINESKNKTRLLWYVPKNLRMRVVYQNHDCQGHFAVDKTVTRIKRYLWFPKMRRFCKKYIAACCTCLRRKIPSGRPPGLLQPLEVTQRPFERVHLDHLGPFPSSLNQNKHLAVAVDPFTKYTIIKACKTTDGVGAKKFLEEIVQGYGVPKKVVTDRGTAFSCREFGLYCEKIGTKLTFISGEHAQANGQVERVNRVLAPMLYSRLTRKDQRDWDRNLPDIQMALNTVQHRSTGFSPFYLLHGYHPMTVDEAPLLHRASVEERETPQGLVMRRQQDRTQSVGEQIKAQSQQKQGYDRNRREGLTYQPGDVVLIRRTFRKKGLASKLLPRYKGPLRIVGPVSRLTYRVEDLPPLRSQGRHYVTTAHVSQIRPWETQDLEIDSSGEEADETISDDFEGELDADLPDTMTLSQEIEDVVPPDSGTADVEEAGQVMAPQGRPQRSKRLPSKLRDYKV